MDDLAGHESEWVDPISIDYRGYKIWECPPNGHGLAVLIALNIARCFDMKRFPAGSAERYHLLIECMRLAFADTAWHVADSRFYEAPLEELLSAGYAEERAKLIDLDAAHTDAKRGAISGLERAQVGSDTVYFATADAEGNGCSFINSTFEHFGSGIVPQGCGYSLQNRGLCFSLTPGHPNRLEPDKRPYHTIIPGLITNAATRNLFAVFGVMGGMMQPQGHLQVVSALLDDALDPQAALDRGRFRLEDGRASDAVLLEDGIDSSIAKGLKEKGQSLRIVSGSHRSVFGLGQIIYRSDEGVLWGGSDPRGDGCAMGPI
jgi:gamma-glutamyltranspeptidase/glutathione hydrolase